MGEGAAQYYDLRSDVAVFACGSNILQRFHNQLSQHAIKSRPGMLWA